MTSKNYQAIADIFYNYSNVAMKNNIDSDELFRELVEDLSNYFKEENERFDKKRFEEAIYRERVI